LRRDVSKEEELKRLKLQTVREIRDIQRRLRKFIREVR
jgi:hypothetical protein